REYTVEMLATKGLKKEFIDTVCYLKHEIIELCATCRKDIMSNKIPNLALSNGFSKQFGLKGNLVNVPMNVDTNVSILPRSFSDTYTIQLKLMRQMKNKNAFMYETIRPKVVHTAVKYLVQQELYKD
ncbi:unnamed protein product, partial [Adineta steineri]